MTSPSEGHLQTIWAQERRDDEQNRRLTVYVSTWQRLVLCGACERLVSKRLNFTDEEEALATDGCSICGADGSGRWRWQKSRDVGLPVTARCEDKKERSKNDAGTSEHAAMKLSGFTNRPKRN